MNSKVFDFLFQTFPLKLGGLQLTPSYLHAVLIVFLLFLLVLTFAKLRRLYVNWSLKGSVAMVILGFCLTLILEGFLLLGGRTLLTEILGWNNAPKPLSTALDVGRDKLIDVLGVKQEIPKSTASQNLTSEDLYLLYQTLDDTQKQSFDASVCTK